MLLSEITQFIKNNSNNGKRSCFDIKHLQDWIKWALDKDYLFVSNNKNEIAGVILVCPIGKWLEVPNMQQVIDSMSKEHIDNDYFIMDALINTKEARCELVNKILTRFKDIESNKDTQIYASVNNKIIKFNKHTILTLKN